MSDEKEVDHECFVPNTSNEIIGLYGPRLHFTCPNGCDIAVDLQKPILCERCNTCSLFQYTSSNSWCCKCDIMANLTICPKCNEPNCTLQVKKCLVSPNGRLARSNAPIILYYDIGNIGPLYLKMTKDDGDTKE